METPKSLFASRIVFFFTHVLAPFAAIGAFAHLAWLGWEGCSAELQAQTLVALGLLLSIPIAAVLRLVFCRKSIGIVTQLLFLAAGFALFFGVQDVLQEVSRAVESWAKTPMDGYCFFLSATILVGAGLGRVATAQWPVSKGTSAGITALLGVVVPVILFLVARAMFPWVSPGNTATIFVIVGGVSIFIALFRVVFGLSKVLGDPRSASRVADLGLTLLFALALPLGGLALNLRIPFPADFANPWAWGLVVWTTLVLLPRAADTQHHGKLIWFLQWTAFPFVLYFFLLFIPFLPLAIFAILFVGAGFLILAPILLFRWTTAKLAAQAKVLRTQGVSRIKLVLLALLGTLILPIAFVVDVEIERDGLQTLLAWHTGENFSRAEEPPPVSSYRARRIVENANAFAFGSEIPFLSAYRSYRVYGGMYLADQLREELNVRVNGKTSGREIDDWSADRNILGAIFGGNVGRRNGRFESLTTRPQKTTACSVMLGPVENDEFEVVIQANGEKIGNAEFIAELGLPAGAWVRKLELEMPDGSWKAGRMSERKAAEWVYRKITDRRRDPSILTTDDFGRARLKVFPVPPTGRRVRFCLHVPDGACADRRVVVNGVAYGENSSEAKLWSDKSGRLTVISAGWAAAHTNELISISEEGEKLRFDGGDPDLYRKLRRAANSHFKTLGDDLLAGKGPVEFVISNSTPAKTAAQRRRRSRQKSSFSNLDEKKLALLRKEYPGQVAFGDSPVDGWFCVDGVPVPYRENEGALVCSAIKVAEQVSDSNVIWHRGALQWMLERDAFLDPSADLRKEILCSALQSEIVSDSVASIALETTMQEKGLMLAELAALHGDKAMEFEGRAEEADAPSFLLLLGGCILVIAIFAFVRFPSRLTSGREI